ncbi:MAG: hypothetical protein WKH64_05795 [Chloroflexia bacterium]
MVYTPVGIRCPDCARQGRSGAFAPSGALILRAAAAAIGVGVCIGLVWGLFPRYGFWFGMLLGFGGGDLVNRAANRRRGPELQTVAALMVVLAFGLAFVLGSLQGGRFQSWLLFQTIMAGLAMVLATMRQR